MQWVEEGRGRDIEHDVNIKGTTSFSDSENYIESNVLCSCNGDES